MPLIGIPSRRESCQLGFHCKSSQALLEDIRLRPAMRFRKKYECASGSRSANRAEADVVNFTGILDPVLRT
jgi:hypothetical protein